MFKIGMIFVYIVYFGVCVNFLRYKCYVKL